MLQMKIEALCHREAQGRRPEQWAIQAGATRDRREEKGTVCQKDRDYMASAWLGQWRRNELMAAPDQLYSFHSLTAADSNSLRSKTPHLDDLSGHQKAACRTRLGLLLTFSFFNHARFQRL